ncbi:uncharacterized protein TIGR03905 [Sphaerochaeta pleomorpha str. Grapes]|uniref:ribonucleoside-diphosphate reductase n=1 Tax=Sphaerochaeta pleomorpha (strain ATCC BAA-1885 / DSM 22778 / Grapes) TaxID=158190 RepID=G8QQN1_SPHPG|nr:TIGR03905 family TSCPD domain-containing protein [Sphaerochaeta pleomorpha]AEV30961.1 uncharacterized protein TIGR03905 [Sphaerochaeta pleomorpha str. Grapes]
MKTYTYKPQGVCSRGITVTVDERNIITDIHIEGGCEGNHSGIIALCLGQEASVVVTKLEGITCGKRKTSCPDQLAKALKAVS